MIAEQDVLASSIHFDPPLYNKRAKKHQVYLIPSTGSILKGRIKGISLRRRKDDVLGKRIVVIDVPSILVYDNRPEYDIKEFPIRELTRESLQYRIRDAFENESRRIGQTS